MTEICADCGRTLKPGWIFTFRAPGGLISKCMRDALVHRPMVVRSLKVGLVVGTILTLLNQGDALLGGEWESAFYWKIPLTYVTPFLVAAFGAIMGSRS